MRTRVMHALGTTRDVRFCLVFPREALSIPVMRRVLGDTLRRLGVDDDCLCDLLLAVTEACSNVIRHAGPGRKYEVVASVGQQRCVLQVLDSGSGFDLVSLAGRHRRQLHRPPARTVTLLRRWRAAAAESDDVSQLAESGRGLAIMRACVDDVTLRSGPGLGTVVSLGKRIEWRSDAALPRLPASALRRAG